MINLSEVITGNQTVELIEPRDSDSRYLRSLRLLLHDNVTGALTELTIEADGLVLPDEPILVLSVMDVDEPPMRDFDDGEPVAERCVLCNHDGAMLDSDGICWTPMQVEQSDEPQPCGCRCALNALTEIVPPAGWCVTPTGEEVDLRAVSGGLF